MICESFFIALFLDADGDPKGHAVSQTLERLDAAPTAPAKEEENVTPSGEATTFAAVLNAFASVITTYRDFLKFIIQLAPMTSRALAERKIGDIVKTKGKKRDDVSNSDRVVYEVSSKDLPELVARNEDIFAAMRGAQHPRSNADRPR